MKMSLRTSSAENIVSSRLDAVIAAEQFFKKGKVLDGSTAIEQISAVYGRQVVTLFYCYGISRYPPINLEVIFLINPVSMVNSGACKSRLKSQLVLCCFAVLAFIVEEFSTSQNVFFCPQHVVPTFCENSSLQLQQKRLSKAHAPNT